MIIIIIDLVIFIVLLYAVKEIVKEALSEFKAEIIQEFGLQDLMEKRRNTNQSDNNCIEENSNPSGQADMNHKESE